ncbi:hypothetical protein [Flavobacterium sp.]|uniref:hypothetical protein n=1 Tax=Flavobacterium sp. TaxID=239 RepID=UPI002FD973FA
MRTRLLFSYLLFVFYLNTYSQKNQTIDSPLSTTAFDSLVIGNLNFMVLGDDNVKQGVSYEYKEDNTELSLSGKLYSKDSFIMTVDGKFAVESGAFIFDETDGSKKGKLNLNFFFNGFPHLNSKFYSISGTNTSNDIDTKRAMLQNEFDRQTLADSTYKKIMEYEVILTQLNIPFVSINDPKFIKQRTFLNSNSGNGVAYNYNTITYQTANTTALIKKIKEYCKGLTSKTISSIIAEINGHTQKTVTINDNNGVQVYSQGFAVDFNIDKLLKDYNEAYSKLEKYAYENNKTEINNFKQYWTAERSNYFGVSPFYERQGFDIYDPNTASNVSFKDRFTEIRSDLYGVNISYNFIYVSKSKSFIIARLLNAIGRSNNFDEYKKKSYSFTTSSENVDGVPIEIIDTRTGYLNGGNRNYEYGTFTETSFELYASLSVAGVFAKIGYKNNDALALRESYPFETGILINLKSKEKKNIIAIQLFMSRLNLNTHPDDDMNFGLKIGLPINISID